MSAISENIRKYRIEKGMKQAELGELLGKAPSVIANWEAGTNRPDVNAIEKICEIFQIDANTLFGWENRTNDVGCITVQERTHIQKYRRLTDDGRATVDQMINTLLKASQAQPQASSEEATNNEDDERVPYPIAALGGGVETKTFSKKDEAAIDDALLALEYLDK